MCVEIINMNLALCRVVCVDKNGKAIELGSGFFGNVYKGFLVNSDGTKTPAAVKMLKSKQLP